MSPFGGGGFFRPFWGGGGFFKPILGGGGFFMPPLVGLSGGFFRGLLAVGFGTVTQRLFTMRMVGALHAVAVAWVHFRVPSPKSVRHTCKKSHFGHVPIVTLHYNTATVVMECT